MNEELLKRIADTINKMVEKTENYEYADGGFEDTKEYNELKGYAREIAALQKDKK